MNAVVESGVSRMRPVMLAAITTMMGMLPLFFDAFFCFHGGHHLFRPGIRHPAAPHLCADTVYGVFKIQLCFLIFSVDGYILKSTIMILFKLTLDINAHS